MYLHEDKDFIWQFSDDNIYGFRMYIPKLLNQNLFESYLKDDDLMIPVKKPLLDKVYYYYDNPQKVLRPVIVTEGQWEKDNEIINRWRWLNLNENLIVDSYSEGYGSFYNEPRNLTLSVIKKYEVRL